MISEAICLLKRAAWTLKSAFVAPSAQLMMFLKKDMDTDNTTDVIQLQILANDNWTSSIRYCMSTEQIYFSPG